MPTQENDDIISALEAQVRHYRNLLDQSIKNKDALAKTQDIYHELKLLSDQLQALKKLQEKEEPM